MRTRTKIATSVAAASLLLGGLGVANAAQLSVEGGSVSTSEASRCATGSVTVAPQRRLLFWWNSAVVTVPAGCDGKPIQLTAQCTNFIVDRCQGATYSFAHHDGGSGTVVLDLDRTTTSSTVWLTIDGWTLPVTVT